MCKTSNPPLPSPSSLPSLPVEYTSFTGSCHSERDSSTAEVVQKRREGAVSLLLLRRLLLLKTLRLRDAHTHHLRPSPWGWSKRRLENHGRRLCRRFPHAIYKGKGQWTCWKRDLCGARREFWSLSFSFLHQRSTSWKEQLTRRARRHFDVGEFHSWRQSDGEP